MTESRIPGAYMAPGTSSFAEFLAAYRSEIATAYPPRPTGEVLLPFPRLFIVARRTRTVV